MSKTSRQDLPPYTIRKSAKAKRVIIKVSARHGLEIIIPPSFNPRDIPPIIKEKQSWIEKAFRKIEGKRELLQQPRELPGEIYFPSIDKGFPVSYESGLGTRLSLSHRAGSPLIFTGDTGDLDGCQQLLKRWLQHQGRLYLVPWLEKVSSRAQLPFQKAGIRGQKSRWGSCSGAGNISLNHNLLFLRPELVQYIMLHELCHTVHLNHSEDFYRLLSTLEPRWSVFRAEMKNGWEQVPWWAI